MREKGLRRGNAHSMGKGKCSEGWQTGNTTKDISSITGIPSRTQSCSMRGVIDAANCLFLGLPLKRLYFHMWRVTRSNSSREKTRTYFCFCLFFFRFFSWGHLRCCAMMKLKLWIVIRFDGCSCPACLPGWAQTFTPRLCDSQPVSGIKSLFLCGGTVK